MANTCKQAQSACKVVFIKNMFIGSRVTTYIHHIASLSAQYLNFEELFFFFVRGLLYWYTPFIVLYVIPF